MTTLTRFECNLTGEMYGALNAGDGLLDFEIRRHIRSPFNVSKRDVHISIDALHEEVGMAYPNSIKYLGVDDGEVVGMSFMFRDGMGSENRYERYEERDSVVIRQYEEFFEFVEEEILY